LADYVVSKNLDRAASPSYEALMEHATRSIKAFG
jgi:hypothetical protein